MPHRLDKLDKLEFRSGICLFERKDGTTLDLKVSPVWQRRFRGLWEYLLDRIHIVSVTGDLTLNTDYLRSVLLADGTLTITLPAASELGDRYYVFNYGSGVITIAGTINGNALGYQLTNQYQYAEFTSVDGVDWIVTLNN